MKKQLVALMLGVAFATSAHASVLVYQADLSGANEAPPNGSTATGTAFVIFDDVASTMQVKASFSGLATPATASHIHCCTATPGTGTAGVATITPSFIGFPAATSGTYDHVFDMTSVSSYRAGFITASGGTVALAFATLLNGAAQGQAYFNIHDQTFPGGEIRGFLKRLPAGAAVPEPAAWAMMLAGFGIAGRAMRRRRPSFA